MIPLSFSIGGVPTQYMIEERSTMSVFVVLQFVYAVGIFVGFPNEFLTGIVAVTVAFIGAYGVFGMMNLQAISAWGFMSLMQGVQAVAMLVDKSSQDGGLLAMAQQGPKVFFGMVCLLLGPFLFFIPVKLAYSVYQDAKATITSAEMARRASARERSADGEREQLLPTHPDQEAGVNLYGAGGQSSPGGGAIDSEDC